MPTELTRLAGLARPPGDRRRGRSLSVCGPEPLLAERGALVVALDQVQDPRNLGAICRTAEAAGAAGVVICERRAAAVTAAACKASAGRGRAPADRPRPQPDRLDRGREGGRGVGVRGRRGGADELPNPRLRREGRDRPRGRGGGLRPRVAGACDGLVSIPAGGLVGSLNVSAAAAVLLFAVAESRFPSLLKGPFGAQAS